MKEPIVLLATPRTGSLSVCSDLQILHDHQPWWNRELGEYTFSIVRDPWMQARSWYILAGFATYMPFEDWCVKGCPVVGSMADTEVMVTKPWWVNCPPTEQLERAGSVCNDIFRLEDADEWWPGLEAGPLRHLGKTTTAKPPFTPASVAAIAEQQAELIERFNYEPPLH